MDLTVTVDKLHAEEDQGYVADSEEALNLVELLRLEAGRFLYEYPAGLRNARLSFW
jgi:hypothetical protein